MARELERRDDVLDSNLGFLLERLLEVRREILRDVHSGEVGTIRVSDLETGGDELVAEFLLCGRWVVQPDDAIGGAAGFPSECIVDVEEDLVTSTDLELLEDVLSVGLSEGGS